MHGDRLRKGLAQFMSIALAWTVTLALVVGCNAANSYRDTIATSFGYITWAQGEYKVSCTANPSASTCALITRSIGLQNAAVDALDAYCNGLAATGQQQWKSGGPCSPVKGLQGALVAALAALNPVIADLKLLATGKSSPKLTADGLLDKPSVHASLLNARIEGGR